MLEKLITFSSSSPSYHGFSGDIPMPWFQLNNSVLLTEHLEKEKAEKDDKS